jgi:hypothetical protein
MGGPNKCNKCKRPRRGHEGPTDDECSMDVLELGDGNGKYLDVSDSDLEDTNPPVNGAGIGAKPKTPKGNPPKPLKVKKDGATALYCVRFSIKWATLHVRISGYWKRSMPLLLVTTDCKLRCSGLKRRWCWVT